MSGVGHLVVPGPEVGPELLQNGFADVVESGHDSLALHLIQPAQDRLDPVLLDGFDLLEGLQSAGREVDVDDAPVVGHPDPLDELPFLHAIHDARGVAERHVEELGDTAHGEVAVMLEEPHDVHMGHAYPGLHEPAGAGATEARDHVVDPRRDRRDRRLVVLSRFSSVDSSHVVNNVVDRYDQVNTDDQGNIAKEGAMRFALMIEAQQGLTYADQLAFVRGGAAAGFEAFFRSDHYASFPGPSDGPTTDAWAVLAGLARETERINLGVLVSPVTFRHPGNFVKVVTTVDEMSGGRIEVGVGAGWNDEDHAPLGLVFPDIRARADLMEDQLALLHGLWTEPDGWSFTGHQVKVEGGFLRPKPVDVPGRPRAANGAVRPRIIVGGPGSPRAFRLAARYADEFNIEGAGPDRVRERFALLDQTCRDIGRDPKTLTRSAMIGTLLGRDHAEVKQRQSALLAALGLPATGGSDWFQERRERWIIGTPDETRAMIRRYADAGVERIMLQDFLPRDLEMVDLMGAELVGRV